MRLSEDRINAIAEKIAFQLVKKRMVQTKARVNQVQAWVEKPILEDLRREDEIDEEVADYIRGLKTAPPPGSFEYQALFQKKKEEVARRRSFTV